MKELKKLAIHLLLLVVAAAFAWVESRPEDESSVPLKPGEVQMWSGSKDDVGRIVYQTKRQIITLEQKKDDTGSYFLGKVEPGTEADAPDTDEHPDAGPHAPPPPPSKVEPATFVSIQVAEKLAKAVASLRAERGLGTVAKDRESVYGLDDPKGTLIVEVGGKKHTLEVGGATPGAGSRYVRDKDSGQAYVVNNDVIRDMEGGASRLSERSVHEWKFADVRKLKVTAGDKTREVVESGTEGRKFWASPDTPDQNDETAGNWFNKLKNLRPIKYLDALPEGATKIVRVEFSGEKKELGFIELYKASVDGKDEFVITTEHLRLHATVAKTLGEQVNDDLASIFSGASEE